MQNITKTCNIRTTYTLYMHNTSPPPPRHTKHIGQYTIVCTLTISALPQDLSLAYI